MVWIAQGPGEREVTGWAISTGVLAVLFWDARDIHIANRCWGRLVRLVHCAQRVEAGIGHPGDADLDAAVARARQVGALPGEQTEDGRFAARRQTHDADFHLKPPA